MRLILCHLLSALVNVRHTCIMLYLYCLFYSKNDGNTSADMPVSNQVNDTLCIPSTNGVGLKCELLTLVYNF